MAWERTLRTLAKTPSKKKGKSRPGKKDTLRRAMRKTGKGSGDGDDGEDGRPSLGTWNSAQNMLRILKELTGTVSLVAAASRRWSCALLGCWSASLRVFLSFHRMF